MKYILRFPLCSLVSGLVLISCTNHQTITPGQTNPAGFGTGSNMTNNYTTGANAPTPVIDLANRGASSGAAASPTSSLGADVGSASYTQAQPNIAAWIASDFGQTGVVYNIGNTSYGSSWAEVGIPAVYSIRSGCNAFVGQGAENIQTDTYWVPSGVQYQPVVIEYVSWKQSQDCPAVTSSQVYLSTLVTGSGRYLIGELLVKAVSKTVPVKEGDFRVQHLFVVLDRSSNNAVSVIPVNSAQQEQTLLQEYNHP